MEEQCSGSLCHFGRGFWNDISVCIIVGGCKLRKLIVSSRTRGGPHAQEGLHVFFLSPWNAAALPCMRFLRPMTTRLLEGSEEDSSNWSSLPLLLLWMIKDRLDFFDNGKVAQVCRHWWQASINNPSKLQTVGGDGMPWIMVKSIAAKAGGKNKCMREFINIDKSKKFVVEMPEFEYGYPLFSRKGWILFIRENRVRTTNKGRVEDLLFLINPLTKVKMQVGVIDDNLEGLSLHKGCFFNGQDGFPNSLVLYYTNDGFRTIRLYITTITCHPPVGGEGESSSCDQVVWTKQSYVVKGFFGEVPGMTVINSHVYIWCIHGEMIIYDMNDRTWKEIPAPLIEAFPSRPIFRVIEQEGDLVLSLSLAWKHFFKYSHAHNSWRTMDDVNLMIFGKHNHNFLTVPITKGIYSYMINYDKKEWRVRYCDYLLKKGTTVLLKDYVETYLDAHWVDIG